MSHFKTWFLHQRSDVMNPSRGLEAFIIELFPEEIRGQIRGRTQDAHMFFTAVDGQNHVETAVDGQHRPQERSRSIPFFSFLRPSTRTTVTCMECQTRQGRSHVINRKSSIVFEWIRKS